MRRPCAPALAIAVLAAACGHDTAPPDAAPGEPTLAAIRGGVFNSNCALSSCHARPTLAARLDLHDDGLCHTLVRTRSCLFGDKLLVVPGKPEASFLMDKLRGVNLTGTPNEECGTTNQRMPLGQPALSPDKLAQIENWIRAGADCGDDRPVDAGVDAPVDAPPETLGDVATLTAVTTTLRVGDRTQVTVALTHGAPTDGQTVVLDLDDATVLGVPNARHLDHGEVMVTFDVEGKLPGTATITASSGTTSKTLTFTVNAVTTVDPPPPRARLAAHDAPARGRASGKG
jgi:hypothetical protein